MPEVEVPYGGHAPAGLVDRLLRMTRALPAHGPGKSLGFALRRLATLLLRGRPLDVEALGARFRLYPYNNVCEARMLFFPRQFDEEERGLIAARLRPGFRFVDVGANVGGYALAIAALAGPEARILAIEPLPEMFARLIYNIRLNPFGTVKALELAVADTDGDMSLFVDRQNQGQSSLKIIGAAETRSIRVPVRRLQTILRDEGFDRLDALKLDVEGAEDLILEEFFAHAPERLYPDLIVLHAAPGRWSIDLVQLIGLRGYRKIAETRTNYVFERSEAGAVTVR